MGLSAAEPCLGVVVSYSPVEGRSLGALNQSTGITSGTFWFLIKNTTNLAGLVALALRPMVWMSLGPS
jgi:hypothetical protein